jgi:hypothetical protein
MIVWLHYNTVSVFNCIQSIKLMDISSRLDVLLGSVINWESLWIFPPGVPKVLHWECVTTKVESHRFCHTSPAVFDCICCRHIESTWFIGVNAPVWTEDLDNQMNDITLLHKVSQTRELPRACQKSTVPNKECGARPAITEYGVFIASVWRQFFWRETRHQIGIPLPDKAWHLRALDLPQKCHVWRFG